MAATLSPVAPHEPAEVSTTVVDVVVPVYNEERALERCVERLSEHLRRGFPFSWRITIADNASTDRTWAIACRLAATVPGVRAIHLDRKGRGHALRYAWTTSDADIVAYMDVDLSTGLEALLPLVAPLAAGHSDLAIGTRLGRGARVVRGPKREVISRSYNCLLRWVVGAQFSDAQCGFKAGRREVLMALLPQVENDNWFFDTELLLLAERNGLRIHEVPVDWSDDPDSRVDVVRTALEDLAGVARVSSRILRGRFRVDLPGRREGGAGSERAAKGFAGQLGSFALVGVLCTVLYLGGYMLASQFMPALAANALVLTATTLLNTALNRRLTFGTSGKRRMVRDHLEAFVVFGFALALSTAGLAAVDALWPGAGTAVQVGALVAANVVSTLARFVLLRQWVFDPSRR